MVEQTIKVIDEMGFYTWSWLDNATNGTDWNDGETISVVI